MTDALSIQEANKLRAALGLQPLPIPAQPASEGLGFSKAQRSVTEIEENDLSTHDKRIAASTGNWQKLEDEREAVARKAARREEIRKAKEKAARFSVLQGRGLGDSDGDEEVDTRTWLKQQRRRQKQIATDDERRQARLDQAQSKEHDYGSKDLAGIKVEHELQDFEGGEDHILTLKDATIDELDEEGDVLENQALREREKLAEKLERKKKKPVYDVHEDDAPGESRILGQYDEEIEGKQRKNFTLDSNGIMAATQALLEDIDSGSTNKPKLISLDKVKVRQKPDYLDPSEIKIRKPKKKSRSTRKREVDDDEERLSPVPASVAATPFLDLDERSTKRSWAQSSLGTDGDVAMVETHDREDSPKRRKKTRPEDIAQQIMEDQEQNGTGEESPRIEGALVIDETTEFLTGLQKPQPRPVAKAKPNTAAQPDVSVKKETGETHDDVAMEEAPYDADAATGPSHEEVNQGRTGIEDEASLGSVAETLALLRSRRMVASEDAGDLNAQDRAHAQLIAAKAKLAQQSENLARQQRERDRNSNRHQAMSSRDAQSMAQHDNVLRGQAESRQLVEIFEREYRPEVELKYTDEFGRNMGQKEAFKHLSHQFHGKGSGKGKTEKRLKKIQAEKEREARSTLDVSGALKEGGGGGMVGAQGGQAKKMGTAGVRLA